MRWWDYSAKPCALPHSIIRLDPSLSSRNFFVDRCPHRGMRFLLRVTIAGSPQVQNCAVPARHLFELHYMSGRLPARALPQEFSNHAEILVYIYICVCECECVSSPSSFCSLQRCSRAVASMSGSIGSVIGSPDCESMILQALTITPSAAECSYYVPRSHFWRCSRCVSGISSSMTHFRCVLSVSVGAQQWAHYHTLAMSRFWNILPPFSSTSGHQIHRLVPKLPDSEAQQRQKL